MLSVALTDEETHLACAFTESRRRKKTQKGGGCGFVRLDVVQSLGRANGYHQSTHVFAANISSEVSCSNVNILIIIVT